jgi:glutamate formiminotransferase / 5-formyltetrahydrofolate cyclo-ligase
MPSKPLLAVPNVSEGRAQATVQAIAQAFTACGTGRLLDVHSDADHHRSVFTLAGVQGELASALLAGACVAVERIDVGEGRDPLDVGEHPHVGAVDVMPVVYLDANQRGAACAEALVAAHELGEGLDVPVFLYGELAQGRMRADLRRGGVVGLAQRMSAGELQPDFGPTQLHPTAGAALVAAREPLVAFNLELSPPANVEDARRIASLIREGGRDGLEGVRAIGVPLRCVGQGDGGQAWGDGGQTRSDGKGTRGDGEPPDGEGGDDSKKAVPRARAWDSPFRGTVPQVSMNIERPLEVPLRAVVEVVRRHAEVARGELVGLAPRAALEGFPADVPLVGFDGEVHIIENALGL